MSRTSIVVPSAAACLLLAGSVPNELAYHCHRRAMIPMDSYQSEDFDVVVAAATVPSFAAAVCGQDGVVAAVVATAAVVVVAAVDHR